MQVLSGRVAAAQVVKITKRSAQFDRVEPQVRRIVQDVRRNGDRALRRYAERWDGLARGASLRVSETRLQSAWRTAPPEGF
jgi:histidinol dehydrogenase